MSLLPKIANLFLLFVFPLLAAAQSPSPLYEPGAIFVKVNSDITAKDLSNQELGQRNWITQYGIRSVSQPFHLPDENLQRTWLLHFEKEDLAENFIQALEKLSFVDYAERVPHYELFYTPNDLQSNQWNLVTTQAELAWNINRGGQDIKVAIVDDAVLLNHPDLAPSIWVNPGETPGNGIDDDGNGYIDDINGYDVADSDNDPNPPVFASVNNFSHGTHVAGIAGASTDNNLGIASIGFDVDLIAVKTKESSTMGPSLQAPYLGVQYAIAAEADIINMSWGGGAYSQTYQNLFNLAYQQGIVCIGAAGNSNSSVPMYPAAYTHVISVGATDQSDAKASFSNYGTTLDLMAPGVQIWSTVAGGTPYSDMSGTSMAAPFVSGIASLMLSQNPLLSPDDIEQCLETTCDNINAQNPGFIGQIGAGRVNAYEALRCVKPISADFTASPRQVCPGQSVQFTDLSTNSPSSWLWTFPGGVPATSTQQNPLVNYPVAGTYDVTLIANNANGSDTLLIPAYITVAVPTGVMSGTATILQGFSTFIRVDLTGSPPWDIQYTDGSATYTVNGITNSPHFIQVSPTVSTIYTLTSVDDANCTGQSSGSATINVNQNTGCVLTTSYNRTFGGPQDDRAYALSVTQDGGSILIGRTESFGAGNGDVYVVKLDACGNTEWSKTYGGAGNEIGIAVEQTTDGGYSFAAYTEFGAGPLNIWLIKTDNLGNVQWDRHYGDNFSQYPRAMKQTPDGGYILAGVHAGTGSFGNNDILLIKTDASGNVQWSRNYGGAANEFLHDLELEPNGGYVLTGYRRNYTGFNHAAFLYRIDASGNILWERFYDGGGLEYGFEVAVLANDQGYVFTGFTTSFSSGQEDILVTKVDTSGQLQWSRHFGGSAIDIGRGVAEASNGNLWILANTESLGNGGRDLYLMELDPSGNLLTGKAIGGLSTEDNPGLSDKIELNPFGNVHLCGWTQSFGAGGEDMFFVKTGTYGEVECQNVNQLLAAGSHTFPQRLANPGMVATNLTVVDPSESVTTPPSQDSLLCTSAAQTAITCLHVMDQQKISDTQGNFLPTLDNTDQFGQGVAYIGDWNNDGIEDVAIGAPGDDDGGSGKGAVYLCLLNANGTVQSSQKISSTQGGFTGTLSNLGSFGLGITVVGDVNSDGVPDLAVSEPRSAGGTFREGAVWILLMNANGTVQSSTRIGTGTGGFTAPLDSDDRFGQKVTPIGDMNADGVPDLATCAIFDDDGGTDRGSVYILYLNANGSLQSHQKISSTQGGFLGTLDNGDNFGTSVASIGDLDQDGVTDLVVGARGDDDGGTDRGAVWIVLLNPNGTVKNQFKISSTQGGFSGTLDNSDRFGIDVGAMGDLNQDAVMDIVVTADGDDDGAGNAGAAWILFLNPTGTVQGEFKISNTQGGFGGTLNALDRAGWGVEGISDLDGNGVNDLILGVHADDDGGSDRGAAWIIFLEDTCRCLPGNYTTFQKTFPAPGIDEGHAVIQGSDGNYVVAGLTNSSGAGLNDFFVLKTDIAGSPLWQNTYGSSANELGYSVSLVEAPSGGYALAGGVAAGSAYNPHLSRLDNNGAELWSRGFLGSGQDIFRAVTPTSDGGFVVGGTVTSFTAGGSNDAWLAKFDANGVLVWRRAYGQGAQEHFTDVLETPDGGFVFTGQPVTSTSNRGAFLFKVDNTGNMLWHRIVDGPGIERVNSVELTTDNGFILGGSSSSFGNGSHDLFLVKLDSIGTLEWAKTYATPLEDHASAVRQTSDRGFILGGYTLGAGAGGSDLLLLKTDPSGNMDWAMAYGGAGTESMPSWSDDALSIAFDGGYLLTGLSNSFSGGNDDLILLKTDPCGNTFCNELDVTAQFTETAVTPSTYQLTYSTQTSGLNLSLTPQVNPATFGDSVLCSIILPPPVYTCYLQGDFLADTVCLGDSTQFWDLSVDSSATIVYWRWDFGDGDTLLGVQDPQHLYGSAGQYSVQLIVGSNSSPLCFDTLYKDVLVVDTLHIRAGADTTICLGDSVPLGPVQTFCGTPPYSYSWTPSNSLNYSNISNPLAAPGTTTFYVVTVTDANGQVAQDTVWVTVNPNCCVSHANILGDSLVCIDQAATFINNSTAQPGASYLWTFAGGSPANFSGANPPPIIWSSPGAFTVTLILNDNCGSDTSQHLIHVAPLPHAITGNDTTVCQGDTFMLGSTPITYHDYLWQPGVGLSDSTLANPIVIVDSSISYRLIVTDLVTGCSAEDSIRITVQPAPTVSLPADTTLCAGQSLNLNPTASNASSFLWSDNSSGSSLTVSSSGLYWVEVSNACGTARDSIQVTFDPQPSLSLGNDTTLCQGQSLTLQSSISGNITGYLWSDNSTGNSLTVNGPGLYWVEIQTANCGTLRDSIQVSYLAPPTVILPADTTLCAGQSLNLIPTASNASSFLWSDNSSGSSLTVSSTGLYWVEVSNACGNDRDSIQVLFEPAPLIDLGADTTICEGDSILLSPGPGFASYLWSTNQSNPTISVSVPGLYLVTVQNAAGCTATAAIEIALGANCFSTLYIPSGYTPNGDGLNDLFYPVENGVTVTLFQIFDRWGKLIFESRQALPGWDGKFQNKAVPEGSYVYKIHYRWGNGKEDIRAGTVTLIR